MRTKTIKLFKLDELTDAAKERAIDNYRASDSEYPWAAESLDSMKSFAALFPVKVTDWSYGGQGSGVTFEFYGRDGLEEIKGKRLFTWLVNHGIGKYLSGNCELTGYCLDESILDPIRAFMKRPAAGVTFRELLQDCFDSWVTAVEQDIEFQGSTENIEETILANEYEFTEDGKRA